MCFLNLRCGHMLRVQLILDKCADSQRCYGSPVITVPIIVISSIARSIKNSLALWNSTFPRMAPKASMPRLFVHSLLQNESVRLSSRPVSFLPWHYLFEKIRKDPYAGIIRTLPILVVGSNFCCCWLSQILAVEIPHSWLSDSPTSRSLFKLWASSVARKRLPRWPWQARNQVHRTIPKWMVYNGKSMKIWMIWGYPVWLWKPSYIDIFGWSLLIHPPFLEVQKKIPKHCEEAASPLLSWSTKGWDTPMWIVQIINIYIYIYN